VSGDDDGKWVMLIGGPRHGEVYNLPTEHLAGVLVMPKPSGPIWCFEDEDPLTWKPPHLDYDHYYERRFVCPDGWRQIIYVHTDLPLDTISETTIVAAIMEPWRAQHRHVRDHVRG
jgi:hypothetical protein